MQTCAVVGVNWGDEGKGRMVDLIAEQYDFVVRYQGGSNAGHTVINEYGKFALNLIPSGIFRKNIVNVLGNGTAIDPEHLVNEIEKLRAAGIEITPERLKISDRAMIVFPYHKEQDALEEQRLADAKYGSTKRGIAPVYGDKYLKKGIMMGELRDAAALRKRLEPILQYKNLLLSGVYGADPHTMNEIFTWLETYAFVLLPYICDTGKLLDEAYRGGKRIMFEAQLGALRDIDFGIYPYTSSSSPLAAYAPIGAGIPGVRVDESIGIVKAYSSCVGEGPFVTEWFGDDAHLLREAGSEYGAATGRPRRVGPFDVVATRYGARMQGADSIALTKLDVLSYMKEIPVCVAYELDGKRTEDFPFISELDRAKPIFETLHGWNEPISHIRSFDQLPAAAREYVLYIEKKIDCPIDYVSIGAGRDEIIRRS